MKQHSSDKTSVSETHAHKFIVLYGLDENQKPRAARFDTTVNRELLRKAAVSLELDLQEAVGPELAEVARKFPPGRLYSSGRSFVPNVRRSLYEAFLDLLPTRDSELNSARAPSNAESSLASSSIPRNACGVDGNSAGSDGLPRSWKDIAVNHLVLVQENLSEGWWEAVVVERHGDVLTARWRDYPKYKPFRVHADAVALLNPSPTFNDK